MPDFDSLHYPYPSRRTSVTARNGVVATAQPLAAQAGLRILQQGGNAIDAAVATAACLTVVEPTSNGIGGDAFALVWTKGKLHGLNSSGPAPKSISIKALKEDGFEEMPRKGWIPVTVPGAPGAWAELAQRFGTMPLTELLKPAIEYAANGFPLSPTVGRAWQRAAETYSSRLEEEEFEAWFDTFTPNGEAPGIGEMWRSPDHAKTLTSIAQTQARSFYQGEIAEKIDQFSRQFGGYLRKEDLADFSPEWVNPIKVNYRGYDVWEIPPNGQGLVALIALNILKGFDFDTRDQVETYHKQIEALKLAFADGKKYITDPDRMSVSVEDLLSDEYADERRKFIGTKAIKPSPGEPPKGGTVYLATADGEGNMVSFIQSNYMGFGSGLVVPGTGISLQNRGNTFSLDPSHDNCLEPGKRTYHTIIPGFLTRGNKPVGPFGVMGGFMQPQGHVQVIMNTVDFNMNPQAALDCPRLRWMRDKSIRLETEVPDHTALSLARRGHEVDWALGRGGFGRGQIIWKDENGVLTAGTEPRADGQIAAW